MLLVTGQMLLSPEKPHPLATRGGWACWACSRTGVNQSVAQAGTFPGLSMETSHQHLLRDLFRDLLFIAAPA